MSIHDQIVRRLTARLFEKPLIQNSVRGDYVEEIIALALEPEWTLCGGDWSGWDLQHGDGCRMQVKQSTAKQTWGGKPYAGAFSIGPSTGYWVDGYKWIDFPGRLADIYIFAWHPETGPACDHRDADQWCFYVVREAGLPDNQRTIRPSVLQRRWAAVPYEKLPDAVARVRQTIPNEALKVRLAP